MSYLVGGSLSKAGGPIQAAHLLAHGHENLETLQLQTLQEQNDDFLDVERDINDCMKR